MQTPVIVYFLNRKRKTNKQKQIWVAVLRFDLAIKATRYCLGDLVAS